MKISIPFIFIMLSLNISSQEKDSLDLLQEILKPINPIKVETLYKPNYPDGIYLNKSEFINKSPGSMVIISPFNKNQQVSSDNDSIPDVCFFYHINTNKLIRNVFAVSYKGHLYFQLKSILKHRNKQDRAQKADYKQVFTKVVIGGENYLYAEAALSNLWASNISLFFGGIGDDIAEDIIRWKGIVWDVKKQEFNIFKSCKDYNRFIEPIYPEGIQACETQQPDLDAVRNIINIVK
ncbi:MAG: hypothetical protein KJO83_03555 [Bacteroidia bacterium]|nr:hypothetical protein [Bacteroidia bacterium]